MTIIILLLWPVVSFVRLHVGYKCVSEIANVQFFFTADVLQDSLILANHKAEGQKIAKVNEKL